MWLKTSQGVASTLKSDVLRLYSTAPAFSQVLDRCLRFHPDPGSDPIFSPTGSPRMDSEIRKLKKKTFEFVRSLVEGLYNEGLGGYGDPSAPLLAMCKQCCPVLLHSLMGLCTNSFDRLETVLENSDVSAMTVHMLSLMSELIVNCSQYFELFAPVKEQLVVGTIFPLLRATLDEKAAFLESPREAVNLGIDVCDEHRSKICKSEAANLLEGLCDHVDGTLSFIFRFSREALSFACGCKEKALCVGEMLKFAEAPFLKKCSTETIMETAMTALSILSYPAIERSELL